MRNAEGGRLGAGAVAGGLMVGMVSSAALTVALGVILIVSAVRTFRHRER